MFGMGILKSAVEWLASQVRGLGDDVAEARKAFRSHVGLPESQPALENGRKAVKERK